MAINPTDIFALQYCCYQCLTDWYPPCKKSEGGIKARLPLPYCARLFFICSKMYNCYSGTIIWVRLHGIKDTVANVPIFQFCHFEQFKNKRAHKGQTSNRKKKKKNKTKQNEVKASAMTCPGFQAISMLVLLFIQYLARFIWGPIWLLKNTCKPNTI